MSLSLNDDGSLDIGAAVPCAEIYENAEIRKRFPGLIDAASLIGGIQIQGRASLGGNICNASPAADSVPSLMALGAMLTIASASGQREIPIREMFAGPGRNTLQPGEILLNIHIPALPPNANSASLRFIPRNEMDIAVANAGAYLQLDEAGEKIVDARIAIGAVGPTVITVDDAVQALIGNEPSEETFARAGEAARAAARPITDMRGSVAQRRHLAGVLTVRALRIALQRIREA
jgi:carbon-monoxide dehydrogenase medium subunit